MTELQSNAGSIGIKLNLEPKPFADVISLAVGNCVVNKSPCDWDMGNWGGTCTTGRTTWPRSR